LFHYDEDPAQKSLRVFPLFYWDWLKENQDSVIVPPLLYSGFKDKDSSSHHWLFLYHDERTEKERTISFFPLFSFQYSLDDSDTNQVGTNWVLPFFIKEDSIVRARSSNGAFVSKKKFYSHNSPLLPIRGSIIGNK
jgi:hypothetical protein